MNSIPPNNNFQNFQYHQIPTNGFPNNQMIHNGNNNGNNTFLQMQPIQNPQQIQYVPIMIPNNNNNFAYNIQPIFPLHQNFIPQHQIQQIPQQQQMNAFPFPLNTNTNVQYVYQPPVYIQQIPQQQQMPMMMGNMMIEMQPMGNYQNNQMTIIAQNNNNSKNVHNNTVNNNSTLNNQQIVNNTNPISSNNNIDSQKRCLNCGTYYKEHGNRKGACRYHTGQYVSSRALSALSKWSCCREFDKNAQGCKMDVHVEDVHTTNILSQFDKYIQKDLPPSYDQHLTNNGNNGHNNNQIGYNLDIFSNNGNNSNNGTYQDNMVRDKQEMNYPFNPSCSPIDSSEQKEGILIDIPQIFSSFSSINHPNDNQDNQNNKNLSANNKNNVSKNIQKVLEDHNERELVRDQNGFYIIDHQVQLDDTLQGLALYYSTTVNEIKFLNNLFSNDIFLRKTLKIRTRVPQQKIKPHLQESKEHKEIRLIRRFILFTNSKPEEARYYLANNSWDVKLAVNEFKDDKSFESRHTNVDQQIRNVSKKNF